MSATIWTTAFSALAHNFGLRRPQASANLDRLSARDLADLNLPSDISARLAMRRELNRRNQYGF
ncbi:MAG: hypothetical protein U1E67_21240 [Hyphomicrobiales bacterium]